MQYLNAPDYLPFGLSENLSDDLVTAASALIDSFCKRPTLGITQYVERLRLARRHSAQLSNTPLAAIVAGASPLVAVRGRIRRRYAEMAYPLMWESMLFLPTDEWASIDVSTIDVAADGMLYLQVGLFGCTYSELEVTYTAGFADTPVPVKVACAQIIRNAQAMPALTLRSQSIDSMRMEYFSGTLLDADVQRMLQPYVAQRMG